MQRYNKQLSIYKVMYTMKANFIWILIVGCQIPTNLSLSLLIFEHSMMTFHCVKTGTQKPIVILQSVCTNEGKWVPNPADVCQFEHRCPTTDMSHKGKERVFINNLSQV